MLEPLLPRLKREIEARLAELRPVVAEAERLAAAKEAMLAEAAAERAPVRRAAGTAPRNGADPQRPNGSAPATPARPAEEHANGRAPRSANQQAILAIVEERPGVSVAEIAAVTKIAKPTVATTVSKLKREGVLADEAGGVKLASRQPLTLSQIAAAAGGDAPAQRDDGVSDAEWEAARRDPAAA
ncbi:MAG TPA: winged helix-turn-helix domain-containing protein [Conexibacter sp.]|nr:winged helix-turn-helix domain-containing protein [Conexibacter sp.]